MYSLLYYNIILLSFLTRLVSTMVNIYFCSLLIMNFVLSLIQRNWVELCVSVIHIIFHMFYYLYECVGILAAHSSRYIILQYISTWNRSEATHIYIVSITCFVFKVL